MPVYKVTTDKGTYKVTTEDAPKPQLHTPDLGRLASNFIPSGINLGKNVGTAVLHPIQTVQVMGQVGGGALQAATGMEAKNQFQQENQQAFQGFKQFMGNRYGSLGALQNTIESDPVGAIADIASLFSGAGGVLRGGAAVAGELGAVSQASRIASVASTASKVGRAIDPMILAGKVVTKPVTALVGATTKFGATASDTGSALQTIAQSVRKGENSLGVQAMRGEITIDDLYSTAMKGAKKIVQDRQTGFQNKVGALSESNPLMDTSSIIKDYTDRITVPVKYGIKKSSEGDNVLDFGKSNFRSDTNAQGLIESTLKELKSSDGNLLDLHNLQVDLNSQIGKLDGTGQAAVSDLRKSILSELDKNTVYKSARKEYAQFSSLMNDMKKVLSLDPAVPGNIETTMNRLRTVLRDKREVRLKVLKDLEEKGGVNLKDVVAGINLNPAVSSNYLGKGVLVGAVLFGDVSVRLLLALLATSPRLLGETTTGISAALRVMDKASNSIPTTALGKILQQTTPSQPGVLQNLIQGSNVGQGSQMPPYVGGQ